MALRKNKTAAADLTYTGDYVLEIQGLSVDFLTHKAALHAVENVSFGVKKGEILGIVGESGCGKSVSCMSILQLNMGSNVQYVQGKILFGGQNLLELGEKELNKIRGKDISVIFQEPMTALNPLLTIGDQMAEILKLHTQLNASQRRERCCQMLEKVHIPSPAEVLFRYPFSLSGGMRQRVMIAMALMQEPKLVIADEPTTALDETIQAQILEMMKQLQKNSDSSFLFVTHDLGVISEMADRVVVMYGGRVCEIGNTDPLLENPHHPYTKSLINSRPSNNMTAKRLPTIPGSVPSLDNKPSGCPFHPRCPYSTEQCEKEFPQMREITQDHFCACWNPLTADDAAKV